MTFLETKVDCILERFDFNHLKNAEATVAGKDGEQNKFLRSQHTNGTSVQHHLNNY
jgi:hypothetical protein